MAFESVNVRDDSAGYEALAKLGVRQVPVLAKGGQWCDGQMIAQVNVLAGIAVQSEGKLTLVKLAERMAVFCPY